MEKNQDFVVGQELFVVFNRQRIGASLRSERLKIIKVGRKWLTLKDYTEIRADKETLELDGGDYCSPGRCYLSEEDYREDSRRTLLYSTIKNRIGHGKPPSSISTELLQSFLFALTGERAS